VPKVPRALLVVQPAGGAAPVEVHWAQGGVVQAVCHHVHEAVIGDRGGELLDGQLADLWGMGLCGLFYVVWGLGGGGAADVDDDERGALWRHLQSTADPSNPGTHTPTRGQRTSSSVSIPNRTATTSRVVTSLRGAALMAAAARWRYRCCAVCVLQSNCNRTAAAAADEERARCRACSNRKGGGFDCFTKV